MNPEAGVASGSCPICVANAVSDSWEEDTDLIAGPLEQKSFDQVLTLAAATGISFQFSTGDDGDAGLDTPVGAAGVPSNSPHATAVGGTSILNKVGASGTETVGWGSNITNLINGNVLDPPVPTGFYGGGGGGESVFFAKPSWQKALPGTGRQPSRLRPRRSLHRCPPRPHLEWETDRTGRMGRHQPFQSDLHRHLGYRQPEGG
jgi:subtilase family serine protease